MIELYDPKKINRRAAWNLFFVLLLAIFIIELSLMTVLRHFWTLPLMLENLIDASALIALLYPILYLLLLRPLLSKIAEIKIKNEELRSGGLRYQAIINTTIDGFGVTDNLGRFLEVNDAYCRLIGYSRQELLKMSIKDVEAAESMADTARHINKVIESGFDRFETRHRSKGGRIIDIEVSVSCLPADGGRFFIFLRDITEQKLYREKLDMLSTAIEQTADMVLITDENGLIEFVNPAFTRQTGYSPSEVMGSTSRILKSGKQDIGFYERLWQTILSGEVFLGILINRKKNGELYYSQKTITPIKDSQGNITHFVSTDKDVTTLKRMEEELMRANKELWELDRLKSEFINMSSHELRTPLAITKEGISQLAEGMCGEVSPAQKRFLDISLRNINRLVRVVDNIFDISEIEFEKPAPKKELMDIVELSRGIIADFVPPAKAKGLGIKADFAREKIMLSAEKRRIRQVLINLISNAVKFSEKGYVEVSLSDKGETVECSVADTGRGIAPENLPKVFDKFQQFERVFGPGEKGAGLGLALVKGIIELHQGKIWVESKLEEGSKFTFILPKSNK